MDTSEMKPTITVHNAETGETIVREMTDEEIATIKPDGENGWDGSYPEEITNGS